MEHNGMQRSTTSCRSLLGVVIVSFLILILGIFVAAFLFWFVFMDYLVLHVRPRLFPYEDLIAGPVAGALAGVLVGLLQLKQMRRRLPWPSWMILQHIVGWACWWGLFMNIVFDCSYFSGICGIFSRVSIQMGGPWSDRSSASGAQGMVVVVVFVISQVVIPGLTMFRLMREPINQPRASVSMT